MKRQGRLGVLGGTFDPIHVGHLDAADAAAARLSLDEMLFVPSYDPPHRQEGPSASPLHRFALVALAVAGRPRHRVSDDEMMRGGRSYTIDFLRRLHADGWAATQIFFILGADAFAEIATWRAFPEVLDAANFAIVARPGVSLTQAVTRTPSLAGRIREKIDSGHPENVTGIFLVDAPTRDVSSTTIRARIAAGAPIDDLVPLSVAQHIAANHLYETVNGLHGQDESSQSTRVENR